MPSMRRRPTSAASFYGDSGYDATADQDGPGGGYASTSNAPEQYKPGGQVGGYRTPSPVMDAAAQHYGTQSANTRGYVGRNPNQPGSAVAQGRNTTGTRLANPQGQGYGYTPPGGWVDDQGNTKVFQTGMYDPTDPSHQYSATGDADLRADNGANAANMWAGEYGAQQAAYDTAGTRRTAAAGAKTAMEGAAGAMPGAYHAPDPWSAPGAMPAPYHADQYTAPGAWQNPATMPGNYAGNGPRSALPTAQDYAADTGTLASAVRAAGGGGPVQADSVGGGGAAFTNYARGASNSLLSALKQQMASATDTAAGRGRVGSGFANQDYGTLARGLAGDAENNILSHALDAANLDQSAAVGNADRRLNAGEFSAGQGQTAALAGLSTAAGTGQSRAALQQGDYSTDQSFGLAKQGQEYGQASDERNFSRSAYDDDRNFGRSTFEGDRTYGQGQQAQDYGQAAEARNFSRSSYDDDRNFGSQQQQTNYGQAADARDFAAGNYRYEDQQATGAGQYADSRLDANRNWVTNRDQQREANKGPGIGGILGGIGGTLLGSALGPIGAAIGGKIGGAIGGGGSQGGSGGGYSTDAPQMIPGFSPQQGGGYDEEEDPYAQYAGGGYSNYNGWQH